MSDESSRRAADPMDSSLITHHSSLHIALFAGEYSGDVQGAALAAALKERRPDLQLSGIGGARMREAGVALRFDSTHWGAMGTYEALKLAPRLLWVLSRVK